LAQELRLLTEKINQNVSVNAPEVNIDTKSIIEALVDLKNSLESKDMSVNVQKDSPVINIDTKGIAGAIEQLRVEQKQVSGVDLQKILKEAFNSLFGRNAKEYIPVRLTNGKEFYTGVATAVSGLAQDIVTPIQSVIDELETLNSVDFATEAKQDTQIQQITDLTHTNTHTGNDELRTYQENHLCAQNTTTTPLAGGATFTGEWEDCLNYQEINVSIIASHDSAMNGLVFQWSADASIIGDTDSFSYYTANGGTNYTPNPAFRYFRIVYTNGATQQTSFSLHTILRRSVTGGSFHRIDSSLKDDSDARLQIVVPKLRTSQNNYISQTATSNGNAKTSLEEYNGDVKLHGLPVNDVWGVNNIDEASATVTYIGAENSEGDWYIKKIDTTSGTSFTHATEVNNGSYTTYATAWTARTLLTYGAYSTAF
jgi:hypothetical protein